MLAATWVLICASLWCSTQANRLTRAHHPTLGIRLGLTAVALSLLALTVALAHLF